MPDTVHKTGFTVRISENVITVLEKMAAEQGRTRNNLIENILCEASGLDVKKEV